MEEVTGPAINVTQKELRYVGKRNAKRGNAGKFTQKNSKGERRKKPGSKSQKFPAGTGLGEEESVPMKTTADISMGRRKAKRIRGLRH